MGHAKIGITLDRYGHEGRERPGGDHQLMPGSEEEAAGLLDDYLAYERQPAEERARAAVA